MWKNDGTSLSVIKLMDMEELGSCCLGISVVTEEACLGVWTGEDYSQTVQFTEGQKDLEVRGNTVARSQKRVMSSDMVRWHGLQVRKRLLNDRRSGRGVSGECRTEEKVCLFLGSKG